MRVKPAHPAAAGAAPVLLALGTAAEGRRSVTAARVEGPADVKSENPVVFVRWDNLTLLTGEKP